jgi:tRNA(Ile)-lysidine synthase
VSLLAQVRAFIQRHDLLSPGDKIVVGVSGGPDSVCLLHLLHRLQGEWDLRLHVAHLHHRTRGEDSDADAAFVMNLARAWSLPATVARRDVPTIAADHDLALEEAARRVRYAFLASLAGEIGAERIAVGHNADDQTETVLMHFLRGAGPSGLRGMLPATSLAHFRLLGGLADFTLPPRLPTLVRPLLDVPRQEIEGYCAEHDLATRFDRSNLDVTYFRNRIRHELIPTLESYNPNIRQRLRHTAQVIAADYELLTELRAEAWQETVRQASAEAIIFDLARWREQPLALQRALIREAAYRLRPRVRDFSFVHVENATRLAQTGETGTQATLPGELMMTLGYDRLTIAGTDYERPRDGPSLSPGTTIPVALPGVTPLTGGDWILTAEWQTDWSMDEIVENRDRWTADLAEDALEGPLTLRTRRPGETFQPQGMGGHAPQLSDWMINAKIPSVWRDELPLLTAGGEILWVCGWRVSEKAIVEPETRRVARFRFQRRE